MQYAERLFGAFQRLRIVTTYGGRIWAESVPNQGATFLFYFGRQNPKNVEPEVS